MLLKPGMILKLIASLVLVALVQPAECLSDKARGDRLGGRSQIAR